VETFKPIVGFPGYKVSDKGTVLGKRDKPLACNLCSGYLHTGLRKDGKQIFKNVHRLVAIAFLPNPDNLPQVNHKDEVKTNNNKDNLEWCTRQYNQEYSLGKRVLQLDKISEEVIREWVSVASAARELNLNEGNIACCCRGVGKTAGGFIWRYL